MGPPFIAMAAMIRQQAVDVLSGCWPGPPSQSRNCKDRIIIALSIPGEMQVEKGGVCWNKQGANQETRNEKRDQLADHVSLSAAQRGIVKTVLFLLDGDNPVPQDANPF